MNNDNKKNQQIKGFIFSGAIICLLWIGYLVSFYSFYEKIYFYIDKRLPLGYQLLTFFAYEWSQSFVYMVIGFVLLTCTLFFNFVLYKQQQNHRLSFFASLLMTVVALFFLLRTVLFPIFLVCFLLAASIVYVMFVFADKRQMEEEDAEILGIYGPFETFADAQAESKSQLGYWQERQSLPIKEDIYLDEEQKYYVEVYVEGSASY